MSKILQLSLRIIAIPISLLLILAIYDKFTYNIILLLLPVALISAAYVLKPILNDINLLSQNLNAIDPNNPTLPVYLESIDKICPVSVPLNMLISRLKEEQANVASIWQEHETITDNLPDILLIIDEELTIINANKCAELTFNTKLVGKNLEAVVQNKILPPYIKWVLHDYQSKKIEIYLENYDIHLLTKIELLPKYQQEKSLILLLMSDISDAKRSEQMFNDFVANASHEIKTPLTSLAGFIELLQTSAKDDEQAHDQFLNIMASQVNRLDNLVTDLLSLSKLEREVSIPPSEIVDLKAILQTVSNESMGSRKAKNMDLKLELIEDLPNIIGDGQQLIRLFTNLVSNSIKYASPDSVITIKANLELASKDDLFTGQYFPHNKPLVSICVIDQSDGIAKEHLPRLTERFYMVDASRTRGSETTGTGLGLAIVKQIILRHRGSIKIESVARVGSKFIVYLPIDQNL